MWIQTGAYQIDGLYWLIAVIVVFVIAFIALVMAGTALRRSRTAMRAGAAPSWGVAGGPGASGTGLEDRKPPESHRMLDERYAKGEISREEYMQHQTDLQPKR